MSMTVDYGATGVKRQSLRKGTPRNFVAKLLEKGTPDEDILERIEAAILKDADFRRAVAEYWLSRERRNLTSGPRTTPAKAPEERAAVVAKMAELKEQAVSTITLGVLDMMIDGKPLREYTFGELAKFSGKLGAISKLGKPNEKVGKLSEAAVRKLFR